jgi:hypothetical protein
MISLCSIALLVYYELSHNGARRVLSGIETARPSIADSIASPRQVATWLVFVVKGHELSNSK